MGFKVTKLEATDECPMCGAREFKTGTIAKDKLFRGNKFRVKKCDKCDYTWETIELSRLDFLAIAEQIGLKGNSVECTIN